MSKKAKAAISKKVVEADYHPPVRGKGGVIEFTAPASWPEVHLYGCADWHLGSHTCYVDGIKKHIKRIAADPYALWIGAGDLAENALINTLGDIYRQTMEPTKQIGKLTDLLKPVAHRCLGFVSGNHGNRTTKHAGLDPDYLLACLLGVEDRYTEITHFSRVKIGDATYWNICAHHGAGGGSSPGGQMNAMMRTENLVDNADLYFVGHNHASQDKDIVTRYIESGRGARPMVRERIQHFAAAGSELLYDGSYAERKCMRPAVLMQAKLILGQRVHLQRRAMPYYNHFVKESLYY